MQGLFFPFSFFSFVVFKSGRVFRRLISTAFSFAAMHSKSAIWLSTLDNRTQKALKELRGQLSSSRDDDVPPDFEKHLSTVDASSLSAAATSSAVRDGSHCLLFLRSPKHQADLSSLHKSLEPIRPGSLPVILDRDHQSLTLPSQPLRCLWLALDRRGLLNLFAPT